MLELVQRGLEVNCVRDSVLSMYFSHLKIPKEKTLTWLRMHTISFPAIFADQHPSFKVSFICDRSFVVGRWVLVYGTKSCHYFQELGNW